MSKPFRYALGAMAIGWVAGCGLVDGLAGGAPDGGAEGTPDAGEPAPDGGSPEHPTDASRWSWQVPQRLEQGEVVQSDEPWLAVRTGGRAYVAFHSYDAGTQTAKVYLATRGPGEARFGPVKPVAAVFGNPIAWKPQVAAGAAGPAVLVFSGVEGSGSALQHLYAARFGDDLVVPASAIARIDGTESDHPQLSGGGSLAVDEAGNAVVAWAEMQAVHVTASASVGAWSAQEGLGTPAVNPWDTVSVAASLGRAIIAFSGDGGLAGRWGTISDGFFDPGSQITLEPSTSAFVPRAAAGQGNGLVVWKSGSRLGSVGLADYWAEPQYFDAPRIAPGSTALAMNAQQHAVATWRAAPEGGGSFYESEQWAAIFDGHAWGPARRVSVAGPHRRTWWGHVAIDDLGNAVVVWADFDAGGTFARIWASVHAASAAADSWSAPVPVDVASPEADLADKPEHDRKISVAMEPGGGGATVVWIQREAAGAPRVWATTLR